MGSRHDLSLQNVLILFYFFIFISPKRNRGKGRAFYAIPLAWASGLVKGFGAGPVSKVLHVLSSPTLQGWCILSY